MRVRDWMSPDPLTVEPSATIAEARRLLHAYGVRHLPVVDAGRLVGVVSDRDVGEDPTAVRRPDAGQREVATVMSSPPHVVAVDAAVSDAARVMLSRRISALPVVDAAGGVVGLVTTTDCLLASLAPQAAG